MAKKHRQRTWYVGLFKEAAERAFRNRKLPEGTVFFDKDNLAYGYAANARLVPMRDENNELVVDEKGYAQLPKLGKLTIIAIKGSNINWSAIEKAPKELLKEAGINGDSIRLDYSIPLNKQTIQYVFEETDEMYERFANSALGRAGGMSDGNVTDENPVPETELGASESHD